MLELIEAKAEGEEIVVQPEAPTPTAVPDLMAALEASLAAVEAEEERREGDATSSSWGASTNSSRSVMRVISNTRCTGCGPRTSTSRRSYSIAGARTSRIARRPLESRNSSSRRSSATTSTPRLALERARARAPARRRRAGRARRAASRARPRRRSRSQSRTSTPRKTKPRARRRGYEMARLRRADCSGPGSRASGPGSGFAYFDDDGEQGRRARGARAHPRARHPARVEGRVDLPVPERAPAGDGHRRRRPQAVPLPRGVAHPPRRREVRRDDALRPRAAEAARAGRGRPRRRRRSSTRERVLACAVRLLDRGFFRVGTEEYTANGPSGWRRCARST